MSAHFARPDIHPALERLADRRLLREHGYVGGRWTRAPGAKTVEVRDPATGVTVAFVASLGAAETAAAIDAAAAAFPAWSARLPQERAAILARWRDLILAARDDLALIMTLEQGKPLSEALGEIDYAASFAGFYAEEATRVSAEGVASHLAGAHMSVSRAPLGVVGLATP